MSTPSDGTFGQTMAVAGCTILMAAAWPGIMWSLGAWLVAAHMEGKTDLAIAAGTALQRLASLMVLLMMAYEACQPHGLGEAHFGWRPRNVRVARRQIGWLTVVIAVFGLPVSMINFQGSNAFEQSLGRLAFIAAMTGPGTYIHGLLNPRTGILRDYLSSHRGSWANRLRYIWYPAAVMVPVSLAVASFIGFHYTALQICNEVLDTASFLVVVVLLYGLARRWIYFGRRTLALEQARARREAYEQRVAKGEADGGDGPPPLEAAAIDISAISGQALQLLRGTVLFSLLIGLFAIWANTFPAISFLNRVELWQSSVVAATDGGAAAIPVMITLEDLLWALALMVITMIVAGDHPIVLNDPAPSTQFKKIGDNGLEIDLRLFIPHIDHFVRVKDEIHGTIHTAFQRQGIRFFAFSHRDIDVRSMSGTIPV